MNIHIILLATFTTAVVGILLPAALPAVAILSLVGYLYLFWDNRQKSFRPQSETYKKLEKINKKRQKSDDKKHKHISDQTSYIDKNWGYNKSQQKIVDRFISERAYVDIYNKLSASLLPQVIELIDKCNEKEKKGCKREVGRRIGELVDIMKIEIQTKKMKKKENYETTLEVYDRLLGEFES